MKTTTTYKSYFTSQTLFRDSNKYLKPSKFCEKIQTFEVDWLFSNAWQAVSINFWEKKDIKLSVIFNYVERQK